jgi:hypothetical protein
MSVEKHVRLAKIDDVPVLVEFAKHFWRFGPYKALRFDSLKMKKFFEAIITGSALEAVCLIALKDEKPVGFIVGAASEPVFSSQKVAMELGWWIEEEHRSSRASLLVFRAYEDWAKRVGCHAVQGAYLEGLSPDLEKFYRRSGYRQVESSFMKVLKVEV